MEILFQILKNWAWFFFPIIFYYPFRYFYFWWIRWEVFFNKKQYILLEIIPPAETKKPISAMEQVFATLWNVLFDDPNWKQRWCEGGLLQAYGGIGSIEICSFGGEIHFYLRIPERIRAPIETAFYSQFPDIEIKEAPDYTLKIPKDVPNEKWDLYAEDYTLMKEDYLPIKTYTKFFERPEEEKRLVEEKRLDPINNLLENMSKLKTGEQLWIQICFTPLAQDPWQWRKEAKEAAEKIAKRYSPKKEKGVLLKIYEIFFPPKPKPAALELVAPELRMTPEEKEILGYIERKLTKQNFQCWIRGVSLWRKDIPGTSNTIGFAREYLTGQFSYYNWLVFFGGTRTRIHYWLRARRLYLRKRQRFKAYIRRLPSLWPRTFYGIPAFKGPIRVGPGSKAVCILSSEELATIFQFPSKITLPTVPRVITKKVGPPPILP